MAKQASQKTRADKQRKNSAKQTRGKPFTKGNPHAFKPGQSGNPNGRPKSITLSEAYRRALAKEFSLPNDDFTVGELIAQSICSRAIKGDVNAAREIADRTEGRPRQALDVDLSAMDWRAMAQAFGLSIDDVFDEAKRIIQSAAATSGAEPDDQEAGR